MRAQRTANKPGCSYAYSAGHSRSAAAATLRYSRRSRPQPLMGAVGLVLLQPLHFIIQTRQFRNLRAPRQQA
jgi:hypothetical protein